MGTFLTWESGTGQVWPQFPTRRLTRAPNHWPWLRPLLVGGVVTPYRVGPSAWSPCLSCTGHLEGAVRGHRFGGVGHCSWGPWTPKLSSSPPADPRLSDALTNVRGGSETCLAFYQVSFHFRVGSLQNVECTSRGDWKVSCENQAQGWARGQHQVWSVTFSCLLPGSMASASQVLWASPLFGPL